MISFTCQIKMELMHARPVATFIQFMQQFDSEIVLRKAQVSADGKSIFEVLLLELQQGDILTVEVSGTHEQWEAAHMQNQINEYL